MSRTFTALITGASRGIGRAVAIQLAARGGRIAVHFHANRRAADATLHALTGAGHALFAADLTLPDGAAQLWREVTAAFGPIDVLVNNAGLYELHPPLTTDPSAWQSVWHRTLAANLNAPATLSHLAAQAMAARPAPFDTARGRGRIVNVSSRGAFRGEPLAPAYGASKAGLNALSQSLARALAPHAVYVFAVAPGWVDTDMSAEHLNGPRRTEILAEHPLGRVATADEIARTIVFCALDAPAAMTGSLLDINGASYLRT